MRARHRVAGTLVLLLASGCGGGSTETPPEVVDASVDVFSDADALPDTATPDTVVVDAGPEARDGASDTSDARPGPPAYDEHVGDRKKCTYGPGDLTTKTIGAKVPHGAALPFSHVVVLMMENRSFDHYFSKLPAYGVTDVDVADDAVVSNPDPIGKKEQKRFKETRYCVEDTAHNWAAVHLQYDDGMMDGFVSTNDPGGARAMGYYDQTDLPYYYWLARTFSTSDRYFSSLLGPTWPNRFFFYGATAWGRTHTPDTPPLGKTKIMNLLDDAGRSHRIYRDGTTSFAVVFGPTYLGSSIAAFEDDVKNDKLPDVAIVDPAFDGDGQNDEHPPTNPQKGQKFSARIVKALMSNPAVWKKTVLFITYDEHGGLYDHVAPPPACEPDTDFAPDYRYDRLGIRVPVMVVSPFARASYVSHLVADHTSITRFIENRFDLPAMTRRDANAWPMLDMFDFEAPPHLVPPTDAPSAEPTAAGIDWCAKHPAGTGTP